MDLQALRSELDTDPAGLGYAGKTDAEIADLMNSTVTARTRERVLVATWEILAAATLADLRALSATDRTLFQTMVSTGEVNIQSDRIRSALTGMFGPGTETRTNLAALQTEPVSRSQELYGEDMGYWYVAQARGL